MIVHKIFIEKKKKTNSYKSIIEVNHSNNQRSISRSIFRVSSRLGRGTTSPRSFHIEAARNFSPRQIRCYEGPGAY